MQTVRLKISDKWRLLFAQRWIARRLNNKVGALYSPYFLSLHISNISSISIGAVFFVFNIIPPQNEHLLLWSCSDAGLCNDAIQDYSCQIWKPLIAVQHLQYFYIFSVLLEHWLLMLNHFMNVESPKQQQTNLTVTERAHRLLHMGHLKLSNPSMLILPL